MGGQARLAKGLREKGQNTEEDSSISDSLVIVTASLRPPFSRRKSTYIHQESTYIQHQGSKRVYTLNKCIQRNVLLLGKMGQGKSTPGNRMLDDDGWFNVNDQRYPQTSEGSAVIKSASQRNDYIFKVYDHNGLFEGASSIDTLSSDLPNWLNLVVFVLKHGHSYDENDVKSLNFIISELQISQISALVLTHCESLSEEERERVIEQFKKDHPSVTKLMRKGILAVGFPNNSYVINDTELSEKVEDDKANLRQLIYSCDKWVYIPRPSEDMEQAPRNVNRRHLCCSIL